jgi:hypothetical protein
MIELPEAINISRPDERHPGRQSHRACDRGNSPHKFAGTPASPRCTPPRCRAAPWAWPAPRRAHLIDVDPGYTLVLGGGGERIIYHESAATIPAKYQFLLSFTDDTHLSVTVQMWGSMRLYERGAERDVEFIARCGSGAGRCLYPCLF